MSSDQATSDDLPPGTLVAERYRVGERLGEGAIGAVYYAEHVTVQRPVAIKVLSRQWLSSAQMVERFRSEARSASAAGHPNIIEVFDAGELPNGLPYIVMEYVAGQQLFEILRAEQGMDVERTARICRDIARALAAAHARGIIHRDLKAENVMVVERDGSEFVKVLDFGVAHVGSLESRRTTPGTVIGTPEYMAPEQVRGKPPTPAIDVYALGVLLHEMLTGSPPFESEQPIDVLAMKTSGPAPSIATRRRDLPAAMIELVDECLDSAPERRPIADMVARRLGAMMDRGTSMVTGHHAAAPRGRAVWLGVGVGAALLIAAVVVAAQDEPAGPTSQPAAPVAAMSDPQEPVPVPEPAIDPEPVEPPAASDDDGSVAIAIDEHEDETPARPSSGKKRPSRSRDPETKIDPPPDPTPVTPSFDSESLQCRQARKRAQEARAVQDWTGVLRNTETAACWSSKLERKRLRVKAFLELGRNDECISTAGGSEDGEIAKWVKLCEKRRGA